MEASRIMPRYYRFFIVLSLLCILGLCHAIYDPSATTVKPPKHREPVLPWYLSGKEYPDQAEDQNPQRSLKWPVDPDEPRQPVIIHAETQTWSPWRKPSESEIEQRTEISSNRQNKDTEQKQDWFLEYDQFDRNGNGKPSQKPSGSLNFGPKQELRPNSYDKSPETHGQDPKLQFGRGNSADFYEGLAADNLKSHKEEISQAPRPKLTVAQYDVHRGVVCPETDSTGQFVYPPDCKFFVNCWKGRAFVQPCAPGTLFNPETLECDFPHKVKCYGGEIADFPSRDHSDYTGRREPLSSESQLHSDYSKLQSLPPAPRCPPHVTGLLPHPTDCTKFLQCANGGGHIMNCGPGTVFNPAISVCDWPRNVRGCENAYKSNEEQDKPLVPPHHHDNARSEYNKLANQKKIACPSDHTGLLPHPETCKKFLQCANGVTYIMDCGPGTAFNPLTSVCDWPYNVAGCSEDKPVSNQVPPTTTASPWFTRGPTGPPSWQNPYFTNHTIRGTYIPNVTWPSMPPSAAIPSTTPGTVHNPNDSRPKWIPAPRPQKWKPGTPNYHPGHHEHNGHDSNHHREYDYREHGTPHYPSYPSSHDHKTNAPETHPHHHYHPQHNHHPQRPIYNPNENRESGYPIPYDQNQGHHDNYPEETTHGTTYPHPGHPSYSHTAPYSPGQPGFSDQTQSRYPESKFEGNQFGRPANHIGIPESNLPPNRRTGYELTPNRQEYGRNIPGYHPGINLSPRPDGNVYVGNNYDPEGRELIGGVWNSATNQTQLLWSSRNKTGRPEVPSSGPGVVPGNWNHPYGQGQSTADPPPRSWNQGGTNHDDKLHQWDSGSNVYQQSTSDNENDRKFDQWALKSNIFPNKGLVRPGMEDSLTNATKPHYPSTLYVTINGTRAHFITKDPEVNQGHSNTRSYGVHESGIPDRSNNGSTNVRPGSDRTNRGFNFSNGRPATDLEAPFPDPANTSYGPAVNLTGIKPDQLPTYHWINRPFPPPQPADLVGTESVGTSHVVAPPMQPPSYYGHNYNESLKNNYYPPNVPSSNLQPPHYAPANGVNYYYPNVPGSELESPHPEGHNNQSRFGPYPSVPATNLQPPSYRPPRPWFTPSNGSSQSNTDVQYPSIPSSDLQPPYHQSPTPSKNGTYYPEKPSRNLQPPFPESSNSTMSKPNGTVGNNYPEVPVKKKILQTGKPKLPGIVRTTSDPNLPSVSIEGEDDSNEAENGKFSNETPDVVEPDLDVDVLDDKQVWKPVLVFENKTKTTTTTETSVIMKIGKKKLDLDLFNIEAAPFHQDEPPFPTYFIPPVQPLSHSNKIALPTPISGQVIRLRGGPGPYEGYVEVQGVNPGWGIVCDTRNSWTLKEAHIVCKQLGYIRGAEMAWQGRNTKNGVPSWIAANTVTCYGNETRFQSCKFTHQAECRIERDAIGVRCMPNRVAHCHKDEIPHDGQCYHLADPESGLNHAEALEYCTNRQSRLIDITNQLENDFISEWLLQKHPEVGSVMTSGVGFTTLNRTIWLWEDSSRAKFRFAKWWPGWKDEKKLPPVIPSGPGCVVMKRKFPCYDRPNSICVADYFFWDADDCSASTKGYAYICKRPYDDIGCTYGKGSQYTGTANVTSSGKACLPWADPKVAHPLVVNVVSREMREKLKAHNYCRNPNPNKESRPWCFASPNGQREYCDIPPCGNIASKRALVTNQCKPKHFECLPGECIPSPWVCDGEEDCTNGADEKDCRSHLNLFQKSARQKLEGYDVEKWMNTPLKTCALRCKEADFTCRSFSHKADGNVCFLSDSNIGMTGGLKPNKEYDYYEMKERSMNCEGMYVCENRKCINQTEVCNGKNDCFDRSDESICTVENLDYDIRLAGSNETHEGRVEVKILGFWGQVCDDGFGMINAEVICKELGFPLGALEVRPGGFYGNLDPPSRFMVDQLKCRGNEKSLRECDFDGWGVHNCQPEEAVGIVCKTAVNSCQEGHWKCDNSPVCIPTSFICDEVVDCPDGSDESPSHCNAPFEIRLANGSSPLQGRVEVRHHGVWGTVCDDDFSSVTAAVICRSLGYGGPAIAKKDGFFGPGEGPIWLDEVFCHGNETQLNRCEHNQWGQNNCDHNEDAGVICSPGDVNDSELWEAVPHLPEPNINHLLPANCGKRPKDFNDDEDNIFAKVVHGTIAPKGTYPWQASIRVRGHSRSSHWCGAVMLSPVHVLTAAHCLEGYNKGTYFVRAGDYNTEIDEGTEMEANIEDYYIHEDFRKGHRMNNDIALVLLKGRGIPLGKDIMPICLPHENTEYPPGLNCTISGFGSIETGKSAHSKDLRYGWIPLLDQSVCKADYIYGEGAISDGMVCAGYLDEGVDTCEGDSGGPLACYHNGAFTLYGITSWGQHCGKANKPGVYVRVSYYRRWIDQKIKESLGGR